MLFVVFIFDFNKPVSLAEHTSCEASILCEGKDKSFAYFCFPFEAFFSIKIFFLSFLIFSYLFLSFLIFLRDTKSIGYVLVSFIFYLLSFVSEGLLKSLILKEGCAEKKIKYTSTYLFLVVVWYLL